MLPEGDHNNTQQTPKLFTPISKNKWVTKNQKFKILQLAAKIKTRYRHEKEKNVIDISPPFQEILNT